MEKPADGDRSKIVKNIGNESWGGNALKNVEINMVWGEYYKGKWSSPKSGDLKKPVVIGNLSSFNLRNLTLCARKEKRANTSERLIFNLYYQDVNKNFSVTFTSKNSPPMIQADTLDLSLYNSVRLFNFDLFMKTYQANSIFPAL